METYNKLASGEQYFIIHRIIQKTPPGETDELLTLAQISERQFHNHFEIITQLVTGSVAMLLQATLYPQANKSI